MREPNFALNLIIAAADASGMSYGKFVAHEYEKRAPAPTVPKTHISINQRKQYKISLPIYEGETTLQAAARYDFPRYLARRCREQEIAEEQEEEGEDNDNG